jgi:hypothetical protein
MQKSLNRLLVFYFRSHDDFLHHNCVSLPMPMASILNFLSPRAPKVLSPVCTLAQSVSSMPISVKHEEDPFIQAPKAIYTSPYSQKHFNSNQRTKNQFRPRNATKGTTSYQLRQYAEATLGGGSLRKIVKLPEGEDENEWLAVNSETVSIWYSMQKLTTIQWWISTTISTFYTDQSPNSAPHNRVLR